MYAPAFSLREQILSLKENPHKMGDKFLVRITSPGSVSKLSMYLKIILTVLAVLAAGMLRGGEEMDDKTVDKGGLLLLLL